MRRLALAAVVALTTACGPSVRPELKQQLDTWRGQLAPSDASFAAAKPGRPALTPGQWAQYLQIDDKGQPSQVTYKILGAEGGAVWLELETTSYSARSVVKMLIKMDDLMQPGSWDVRRMITQQDDQTPQELPPFVLGLMSKQSLGWLKIATQVTETAHESVKTPAGTFDTFKIHARTETSIGTFEGTAWLHDAVPVTGFVRSEDAEHKWSTELVAFGTTGATSAISGL